jgi:hypothetical protein
MGLGALTYAMEPIVPGRRAARLILITDAAIKIPRMVRPRDSIALIRYKAWSLPILWLRVFASGDITDVVVSTGGKSYSVDATTMPHFRFNRAANIQHRRSQPSPAYYTF